MLKLFRKDKQLIRVERNLKGILTDRTFDPQKIYLAVTELCVSRDAFVGIGTPVGKKASGEFVCSGVSGTVTEIKTLSDGCFEVVIENDGLRTLGENVIPFGKRSNIKVTDLTPDVLVDEINGAGVVTRGRKTLPRERSISKRILASSGKAKQIVINCAFGDPYDRASSVCISENASYILSGMKILMAALKIGEGVLLVDSSEPCVARALTECIGEKDNIKVFVADVPYPSDSEHLIMYALTSIEISASKNAERVGCAVFDRREAEAIGRAFLDGMKETSETVTVSFGGGENGVNLEIPYGTKFAEIAKRVGAEIDPSNATIAVGGLLQGREVSENDVFEPSMSPIVFFDKNKLPRFDGMRCIKCGECARVCPMLLMPMYIDAAGAYKRLPLAKSFDLAACIECGACQYVCPAEIPLLANIRRLKALCEEKKALCEEKKDETEVRENEK